MYSEAEKHFMQQLEQIITILFACRSLVKYNLSLDGKQQEEILQDIDASLQVLRQLLLSHRTVEPHLSDSPCSQTDSALDLQTHNEKLKPDMYEHETLQALYRMYNVFMHKNERTNLQSFISRFDEVVAVLGEVQRLFEQSHQSDNADFSSVQTTSPLPTVIEGLLQKVREFISDLYYILMDFIRTLSSVLQQNDVHINTDKLSSISAQRSEKIRRIRLERLHEQTVSLQDVQATYQQLLQRRLQAESQISVVTAFLGSLKETLYALDVKGYKRSETIAQTDTVIRLLAELLHIVTDYERISGW